MQKAINDGPITISINHNGAGGGTRTHDVCIPAWKAGAIATMQHPQI
jgi:hypothetical protein